MDDLMTAGLKTDPKTIEKYKNILPDEIIKMWETYGYCSLLGGYLRAIDPDEYSQLLKNTYFNGNNSIPVFVTAFGDIVTYERQRYVGFVSYRNHNFNTLAVGFKHFFMYIKSENYVKRNLCTSQFNTAREKIGVLSADECYGYFPLLCAGGKESSENIKKVKTKEHIMLITQFAGIVGGKSPI